MKKIILIVAGVLLTVVLLVSGAFAQPVSQAPKPRTPKPTKTPKRTAIPDPTLTPTDPPDPTLTPTDSPSGSVSVRVVASSDDVEESASGALYLNSGDLELVYGDGSIQTIGMRFNSVIVPQGAPITNAYIQFQVDETDTQNPCNLIMRGEDVDNATTFTTADHNVTNRVVTDASVGWSPPEWDTVGEQGLDQRTPNIASVIQEIVDRPGWLLGNSLVVVVSGEGERVAEAYDGSTSGAPLLYVEYGGEPPPTPTTPPSTSTPTTQPTSTPTDPPLPTPTPTNPPPTPTPNQDPGDPLILSDKSGDGGDEYGWNRYFYEGQVAPAIWDQFDRADNGLPGGEWYELEALWHRFGIQNQMLWATSKNNSMRPMISHPIVDSWDGQSPNMYLRDLVNMQLDWHMYRTGSDEDYAVYIQVGQASLMDSYNKFAGIAASFVYRRAGGTQEAWFAQSNYGQNEYFMGVANGYEGLLRVQFELRLPYQYYTGGGSQVIGGNIFPRFTTGGVTNKIPFVDPNVVQVDTFRIFLDRVDDSYFADMYFDNIKVKIGDVIDFIVDTGDVRVLAPRTNPYNNNQIGCDEEYQQFDCDYGQGTQHIASNLAGMGLFISSVQALWCPTIFPTSPAIEVDWLYTLDSRIGLPGLPYGYRDTEDCGGNFFSEGLHSSYNPNEYYPYLSRAYGAKHIWTHDVYFDPLGPRYLNDLPWVGPWAGYP